MEIAGKTKRHLLWGGVDLGSNTRSLPGLHGFRVAVKDRISLVAPTTACVTRKSFLFFGAVCVASPRAVQCIQ